MGDLHQGGAPKFLATNKTSSQASFVNRLHLRFRPSTTSAWARGRRRSLRPPSASRPSPRPPRSSSASTRPPSSCGWPPGRRAAAPSPASSSSTSTAGRRLPRGTAAGSAETRLGCWSTTMSRYLINLHLEGRYYSDQT